VPNAGCATTVNTGIALGALLKSLPSIPSLFEV